MANEKTRGHRQRRTGKVLSARNAKTIVVGVEWSQRHPVYQKRIRRLTKFVAHDEKGVAARGDTVLIEETRPLSATKRWRLVEIVKKGEATEVSPDVAGAVGPEAAPAEASR
jgi:small subunit ribosomal protein S17